MINNEKMKMDEKAVEIINRAPKYTFEKLESKKAQEEVEETIEPKTDKVVPFVFGTIVGILWVVILTGLSYKKKWDYVKK